MIPTLNLALGLAAAPGAEAGWIRRQETRIVASLNHPNIAAIYGLEESQGSRFHLLELVPR